MNEGKLKLEKLCDECKKLDVVGISTFEEGSCRNCGKTIKVKWVDIDKSATCPYCNKTMSETEGSSVMFDDRCEIQCAYCGKIYAYSTKGYKTEYPLFKDLTAEEVLKFKQSVHKLCREGFETSELELFHPIVRIELVRLIKKTMSEQNLVEGLKMLEEF